MQGRRGEAGSARRKAGQERRLCRVIVTAYKCKGLQSNILLCNVSLWRAINSQVARKCKVCQKIVNFRLAILWANCYNM